MASVEIKIIVRDDQENITHDVSRKISKDELHYNNLGAMNFGTTTFKEMFKNILKTVAILAK